MFSELYIEVSVFHRFWCWVKRVKITQDKQMNARFVLRFLNLVISSSNSDQKMMDISSEYTNPHFLVGERLNVFPTSTPRRKTFHAWLGSAFLNLSASSSAWNPHFLVAVQWWFCWWGWQAKVLSVRQSHASSRPESTVSNPHFLVAIANFANEVAIFCNFYATR